MYVYVCMYVCTYHNIHIIRCGVCYVVVSGGLRDALVDLRRFGVWNPLEALISSARQSGFWRGSVIRA